MHLNNINSAWIKAQVWQFTGLNHSGVLAQNQEETLILTVTAHWSVKAFPNNLKSISGRNYSWVESLKKLCECSRQLSIFPQQTQPKVRRCRAERSSEKLWDRAQHVHTQTEQVWRLWRECREKLPLSTSAALRFANLGFSFLCCSEFLVSGW